MAPQDASSLRGDPALLAKAAEFAARLEGPGGRVDPAGFVGCVDLGVEPPRGRGERVWVLDPIDGTKGLVTGQGYVVGLALTVGRTLPLTK